MFGTGMEESVFGIGIEEFWVTMCGGRDVTIQALTNGQPVEPAVGNVKQNMSDPARQSCKENISELEHIS